MIIAILIIITVYFIIYIFFDTFSIIFVLFPLRSRQYYLRFSLYNFFSLISYLVFALIISFYLDTPFYYSDIAICVHNLHIYVLYLFILQPHIHLLYLVFSFSSSSYLPLNSIATNLHARKRRNEFANRQTDDSAR